MVRCTALIARMPLGSVGCCGIKHRCTAHAGKAGVEWLLLPKGFASFCQRPRIKLAAYVHDVMGEHYRQQYRGDMARGEAWYFGRSLLATLRHAALIFTNSDFTRRELLALSERHAIRPPEIVVAGIGFVAATNQTRSDRPGIVVLASPWPHKRTDLAVEFMTAWQRATDFAGRVRWVGRFPAGVHQPSYPRWEYHARLDERAYRALLAESQVVVYFSEDQGFGMPPVEAVLSGACPVYSAIPATVETMRGAGAPFENSSFESFTVAIDRALQISPEELSSTAESLLSRHNWPAVADRIVRGLTSQGTPS